MFKPHYAEEVSLVHLYAKVAIGSSGAPTLDTAASRGIASITRTSAGLYQLTLSSVFNSLMSVHVMVLDPSLQDITVQAKAMSTSAKTLDFWTKTGATATDPQSGATLYIRVIMKNSSV